MGAKAAGIGTGAVVLLMPFLSLLGVATLIAPSAASSGGCLVGQDAAPIASLGVAGDVPSSLVTQNANGETVTLNQRQLQRAAAVIAVGKSENIPARGQLIALMALTESSLRVLSNAAAYPASTSIPNDGDGGDHDSIGLVQMRPSTGWGELANLMDPVLSSRAFYSGPQGPNHGSPRGLLDIKDWQSMDPAPRPRPSRSRPIPIGTP